MRQLSAHADLSADEFLRAELRAIERRFYKPTKKGGAMRYLAFAVKPRGRDRKRDARSAKRPCLPFDVAIAERIHHDIHG